MLSLIGRVKGEFETYICLWLELNSRHKQGEIWSSDGNAKFLCTYQSGDGYICRCHAPSKVKKNGNPALFLRPRSLNQDGRSTKLPTDFPERVASLDPSGDRGSRCRTGLHNLLVSYHRKTTERLSSRCTLRERVEFQVVLVSSQYRNNREGSERARWTIPDYHRYWSQGMHLRAVQSVYSVVDNP